MNNNEVWDLRLRAAQFLRHYAKQQDNNELQEFAQNYLNSRRDPLVKEAHRDFNFAFPQALLSRRSCSFALPALAFAGAVISSVASAELIEVPQEGLDASIVDVLDGDLSFGNLLFHNNQLIIPKNEVFKRFVEGREPQPKVRFSHAYLGTVGEPLLAYWTYDGITIAEMHGEVTTSVLTVKPLGLGAYSPAANLVAYHVTMSDDRDEGLFIQSVNEDASEAREVASTSDRNGLNPVKFSPDGRLLATSHRKRWTRNPGLYEEEFFLIDAMRRELIGSKLIYGIDPFDAEYTADGSKLVLAGRCPPLKSYNIVQTGSILMIDTGTLEVDWQHDFPSQIFDFTIAEEAGLCAFVSPNVIHFATFPSFEVFATCAVGPEIPPNVRTKEMLRHVELSEDGRYLAFTNYGGAVTLVDVPKLLGEADPPRDQ